MNLYISPMSGSFPAHVTCIEAGLPFTLHTVRRRDKRLDDGREYKTLAPQGIVPAVGLPDGSLLTESSAVLQWLADRAPERQLAPPRDSDERYRLVEWLNFISTELHKKHIWMIFSSKTPEPVKAWARDNIGPVLRYVDSRLAGRDYLLGSTFTVADAYLFWALFVLPHGGVSLEAYPSLRGYVDRLTNRPSIAKALQHEGPRFLEEKADAARPQASAGA